MSINLALYQEKLNIKSAEFIYIDHDEGIISTVYKVVDGKRTYILKICPRNEDYYRELFFLRELRESLPVPQILQIIPPFDGLHGAILMEYLDGSLLKATDWTGALAYELGVILAKLHRLRTEGYGDLASSKKLVTNPEAYFREKFEEELDECKGHLPKRMVAQCHQYYADHQNLLADVDGPCMVHRDFRPGNLIVCDGKLQGVIDWAGARSGFAEQDFCSIEHFKWPVEGRYKKSLLAGYASIRLVPNYQRIMPLLRLGRALGVIGYTVKSNTWNGSNAMLYDFNRAFLDAFPYSVSI